MSSLTPMIAAIGLFFIAGAASAQSTSQDPAAVQAGAYDVEPFHTRVRFTVVHFGFTRYWGDATGVSGRLVLDPRSAQADSISVTIPVATISTTNAKLDSELKSPMFLDGGAHPMIAFVSRSVTQTSPTTAAITGDLTLHGVTKPVTLHAKFNAAGLNPRSGRVTVGFDARGEINRSDFGVKAFVPMVSDAVDIDISAAFEKSPS